MKSSKSTAILTILGIGLIIICIASSVFALTNAQELKALTADFTNAGNTLTAEAEILKHNIDAAKEAFKCCLAISALSFLGAIIDLLFLAAKKK